jgi:UDP-N-acetylglucosamine--N-acetylmuramyl-(pentapeptide) pyrophosphoryl-undecaprenol N-acetylglucosamine transferase
MSTFALMAGGTGGHLFPAMALAQELRRRGHVIHLITDHRVDSYGGNFPAEAVHVVPAATPSVRNPIVFGLAGLRILRGIAVAWGKLQRISPDAVVGFGGYPVYPPFVAASLARIPGLLHEQNAVMGRANRALARFARVIALSYETTRFAEAFAAKSMLVGNPLRDRVWAAAKTPFPELGQSLRRRRQPGRPRLCRYGAAGHCRPRTRAAGAAAGDPAMPARGSRPGRRGLPARQGEC